MPLDSMENYRQRLQQLIGGGAYGAPQAGGMDTATGQMTPQQNAPYLSAMNNQAEGPAGGLSGIAQPLDPSMPPHQGATRMSPTERAMGDTVPRGVNLPVVQAPEGARPPLAAAANPQPEGWRGNQLGFIAEEADLGQDEGQDMPTLGEMGRQAQQAPDEAKEQATAELEGAGIDIEDVYNKAVEGAGETPDPELSRADKGLLLMDFGTRLMAAGGTRDNKSTMANLGESLSGTLGSYQNLKGRRRSEAMQDRQMKQQAGDRAVDRAVNQYNLDNEADAAKIEQMRLHQEMRGNRELKEDADGNMILVDKAQGVARPVIGPDGQAVRSTALTDAAMEGNNLETAQLNHIERNQAKMWGGSVDDEAGIMLPEGTKEGFHQSYARASELARMGVPIDQANYIAYRSVADPMNEEEARLQAEQEAAEEYGWTQRGERRDYIEQRVPEIMQEKSQYQDLYSQITSGAQNRGGQQYRPRLPVNTMQGQTENPAPQGQGVLDQAQGEPGAQGPAPEQTGAVISPPPDQGGRDWSATREVEVIPGITRDVPEFVPEGRGVGAQGGLSAFGVGIPSVTRTARRAQPFFEKIQNGEEPARGEIAEAVVAMQNGELDREAMQLVRDYVQRLEQQERGR